MPTQLVNLFNQQSQGSLWSDPDAFATSLLVLFIDTYGTEGLQWHPNTIEIEVEHDFRVEIPPSNFDRLMAAIGLFLSNSFFHSVPDFVRTCVILNGHHVPEDHFVLADAADCAWGITEALLLNPSDQGEPFSEEVRAYVGKVLDDEGILVAPDVLRIGLRDRDLADHVRYNFSDDPEMFSAIHGMEKSKTDAINHLVKGRLRALFQQLGTIQLKNAETAKVRLLLHKMLSSLPEDEDLPKSRVANVPSQGT